MPKTKKVKKPWRGRVCSPDKSVKKGRHQRFTCLDRDSLLRIVDGLKMSIPNIKTLSDYIIWKKIQDHLIYVCDNESCWIDKTNLDYSEKRKLHGNYRPRMPSEWKTNPREWLDTFSIQNVLRQYQKKHKDFFFPGAVPIDFDHRFSQNNCVVNELCNIDVNGLLKRGKNKLGVVFNLDKHNESGSHWIGMFAHLNEGKIYFFDSYGYEPPNEVKILINRIKSQLESNGIATKVQYNDIRHQRKHSECGTYCIHFIVKMLEGESFENISKNIIDDDTMFSYRKLFFND